MTTTASAAPTEVRTPSSPRRADLPHHTQPMSTKPPSQPAIARTQNSRQLSNVARRDQEQSNLAAPSPRPSNDYHAKASDPRAMDAARAAFQTPRNTSARHAPDSSTPATNGTSAEAGPRSSTNQPRRRTTVTAQTGTWALQKTIGQGSMGKVKLAKNLETGEQVIRKSV